MLTGDHHAGAGRELTRWDRSMVVLGCVSMSAAVAFAAIGNHLLSDEARQAAWRAANQQHFFHSLGLLFWTVLPVNRKPELIRLVSLSLLTGLVLFCGAIYMKLLVSSPPALLGKLPPWGGSCFILGWLLAAFAVVFNETKK